MEWLDSPSGTCNSIIYYSWVCKGVAKSKLIFINIVFSNMTISSERLNLDWSNGSPMKEAVDGGMSWTRILARRSSSFCIYSQMGNILVQLFALKFPRTGSLVEEKDGQSIKGRPLIVNMNHIVVHTNAPASILPS